MEMALGRRAADLSYRVYGRIRHRDAASVAEGPAGAGAEEEDRAESALQANYGLGRRLYETPQEPLGLAGHYVEVTPAG